MRSAYSPSITDESSLLAVCDPFLKMTDDELLAIVPPQGGFYFQGCPNCEQGGEDYELEWNLSLGNERVRCRYCQVLLPSEKYPENAQLSAPMPDSGAEQVFRYYQDAEGNRYFFQARRWFEQRELMEKIAYDLAQLNAIDPTKHADAGRRARLILLRFAQVYPDYIVRFDYPHKPKEFFAGNAVGPASRIPDGPYRLSKWSWWAYMDVSRPLLLAYDLLRANGVLDDQQQHAIQSRLFDGMLDFVAQYDGTELNNMHPTLWISRIIASRVLDRPALAEQCLREMNQLVTEQFTYDGMWREGTPSYHLQTTGGLRYALQQLQPNLDQPTFDQWLNQSQPALSRALDAVEAFRLPNGHYAAVHDSWPQQQSPLGPGAAPSVLLPGMGYAILASGTSADDALQAHLKFSGRFGHEHYDSLNFMLFANGRELISDIGYTHTLARAWTTATSSHNTVLIDQLNQPARADPRRAMGSLRIFDVSDPAFQVVQADVNDAYPGVSTMYRRTLVLVNDSSPYVIDVFQAAGGNTTHDWILHGSADHPQALELRDAQDQPIGTSSLDSLLPNGTNYARSQSNIDFADLQGSAAYSHFRDVRAASAENFVATFRFDDDPQRGHRTWLVGDASKVYLARSWAVRGTGLAMNEDKSKLDQFWRSSLIVRRAAPTNTFVAVHQPTPTGNAIARASRINSEPDEVVALKIELAGGEIDYFVFRPNDKTTRWHVRDGTNKLSGDARVALVNSGGAMKMFDGTLVNFNQRRLTGKRSGSGALVSVQENRLTVAGHLDVQANQVIVVEHGDGTTSGFHVAAVERTGNQTVITTVEPPVLSGDATGDLRMLTFPRLILPAPHRVRVNSIATTQPSP